MQRRIFITLLAGASVLAGHHGQASPGHAPGEAHGATALGQPGNTRRPARSILVTMREKDGAMIFVPNRFDIRQGEQIRFLLRNAGALDHEFVLATAEENQKHLAEMLKNPDMEHDDPNAKRLKPGASGEILWHFTKAGEFDIACLIPGHRQSGMHATVVVK